MTFKALKAFKKVNDIRDKYIFEKELGRGSFGVVYQAKVPGSQVPVAVKSMDKS